MSVLINIVSILALVAGGLICTVIILAILAFLITILVD